MFSINLYSNLIMCISFEVVFTFVLKSANTLFVYTSECTNVYTSRCTVSESAITLVWQFPGRSRNVPYNIIFFQDSRGKCQMSQNLPIQKLKSSGICPWTYIYIYIYIYKYTHRLITLRTKTYTNRLLWGHAITLSPVPNILYTVRLLWGLSPK